MESPSKKYYEKNKEAIIKKNNANYKVYYATYKQQILQKKRDKYKKSKQCKNSLIDNIPDDVMHNIFQMKHHMEFNPCLDTLRKLKYQQMCHRYIDFFMYRDIKRLFKPISYRKSLAIILDFDDAAFFDVRKCCLHELENDIDATIHLNVRTWDSNPDNASGLYDYAVIRYKESRQKNPVLAIDLIEIFVRLNFTYDGDDGCEHVSLIDIVVKHYNRQFDQIFLELVEC
jgi:hypothetical protein